MRDARGEQHGVLVVPERVAVVFDDDDHLNFLLSGVVVYHPFCKFRLAPLAGSARRSV